MKESLSRFIAKLEPKFDEISVFFISIAFILTFLVHIPQIVNLYKNIGLFLAVVFVSYIIFASLFLRTPFITALVLFFSGLVLSLYGIFSKKIKNQNDRKAMAFFAVTTNTIAGIVGAYYAAVDAFELKNAWLYVFPTWALVNSFLLVLKCKAIEKNEAVIADENASLGEIILGLVALVIVFWICHFKFEIYWPFTLSICVVYATSFSKAFGNVFLGKKASEQPAGANDK